MKCIKRKDKRFLLLISGKICFVIVQNIMNKLNYNYKTYILDDYLFYFNLIFYKSSNFCKNCYFYKKINLK